MTTTTTSRAHILVPSSADTVTVRGAARVALVADGVLAVVLGTVGLFTSALQSAMTGLAAEVLLVSSVALLPYGARALQVGFQRRAPRNVAEGLVLFNAVWALAVIATIAAVPHLTGTGIAVVAGNLLIPAVVGILLATNLRRRATDER